MADTKCMGQIHLPKGFASVKAWTTEDHIVFRTTAQNSRSIKKKSSTCHISRQAQNLLMTIMITLLHPGKSDNPK